MENETHPKRIASNILTTAVSARIWGTRGVLKSVHLTNDTESGKLVLYDGDSASGTRLITLNCVLHASDGYTPQGEVKIQNGLYAAVTGAHSDVTIEVQSEHPNEATT
jgi:hypothetical protein